MNVSIIEMNKMEQAELNRRLHDAVFRGSARACAILIAEGANPDFRIDGSTALHQAVRMDSYELSKILIQCGADPQATEDETKNTALHLATAEGNIKVCEVLIESGADVNASNALGSTPLHVTEYWYALEVCQLLVSCGADVQALNSVGQTVLHRAATWGDAQALMLLIDAGAPIGAQDRNGWTALHHAALSIHAGRDTFELLLAAGEDMEARDHCGKTALHIAAENDDPEVYAILIELGADPNAMDNDGSRPLDLVCRENILRLAIRGIDMQHGPEDLRCITPAVAAILLGDRDVFLEVLARDRLQGLSSWRKKVT